MARARNLKPSLFMNEELGTRDPFLTLLFEGLWCLADREGRLEDRPLRIKAEIFPYRTLDVNRYLTELHTLGFILRYEVDGARLIQVVNFLKHQNPHKTERQSVLPAYSDGCRLTVGSPLNNGSRPADSLLPLTDSGFPPAEESGEPKIASPPPPFIAIPLNDGTEFDVTEAQRDEWVALFPAVDVAQQLRSARAWCIANPNKRKTRRGVMSFLTSWLSREQDKPRKVPHETHQRPDNSAVARVDRAYAHLDDPGEPRTVDGERVA